MSESFLLPGTLKKQPVTDQSRCRFKENMPHKIIDFTMLFFKMCREIGMIDDGHEYLEMNTLLFMYSTNASV
jgi:hypothetical protein